MRDTNTGYDSERLDGACADLNSAAKETQAEVGRLLRYNKALRDELAGLKDENRRLHDELAEAEERLDDMVRDNMKQHEEIKRLEGEADGSEIYIRIADGRVDYRLAGERQDADLVGYEVSEDYRLPTETLAEKGSSVPTKSLVKIEVLRRG